MAMGMFTGIPLPFYIWDEGLTKAMIASLPLIGMIVGLVWWVISLAFVHFELPIMMGAALLAIIPFLLTGFIHLDGYMDTSDALLSRRDLAERIRILKEPTVGAYAVVMLAILFMLQFAAAYTLLNGGRYLALLIPICVISRSVAALSMFELRYMKECNYSGLIDSSVGVKYKIFVILFICGAVLMSVFYAGLIGALVSLAAIVGYACAMRVVYKSFGGILGDLLGYSTVISELCGLVALAMMQGAWI